MKRLTLTRSAALAATAALIATSTLHAEEPMTTPHANQYDRAKAQTLAERQADWRNGAIVYQVIVDRFAPPENPEAKAHLYPAPKTLRPWSQVPTKGTYLDQVGVWSHEIDFWGGDLQSLRDRLDYIDALGVDVLYINPIHMAYTNHKYDAQDYFEISPEYGTRQDLRALADAVHGRQMRLVLDGVFNHMGRTSPAFQDALTNPESPWRDWFYIGDEYERGYRAWANVENLPEVNLENPIVQKRLFEDPDSAIQGYLRDGADGWRLDVAFDIGFDVLSKITQAAHRARPGSLVTGEIWNYPEEWSPALDSVMNFHARQLILYLVNGEITARHAGRSLDQMIQDTGLDPILKSWIILDNHDTPRLNHLLKTQWQRHMAQVLQFTLPGSPCIYYGVELGMDGGEDPANRAPMRWDLVDDSNKDLQWMRQLITMRNNNRALRVGEFRLLETENLLAFMRLTDRASETTLVVLNPTSESITEVIPLRDSKLMNWDKLRDELSNAEAQVMSGTTRVTLPPRTARVFRAHIADTKEYTPYKRVQ